MTRYRGVIERARHWLDSLEMDPVTLRERGLMGKKKYTEYLDSYQRLWQIADEEDRSALRQGLPVRDATRAHQALRSPPRSGTGRRLLCCLRYLRFVEKDVYREGLEFLLSSQHPDGSFGDIALAQRAFAKFR
jgi:hypothetical protein